MRPVSELVSSLDSNGAFRGAIVINDTWRLRAGWFRSIASSPSFKRRVSVVAVDELHLVAFFEAVVSVHSMHSSLSFAEGLEEVSLGSPAPPP